MTVKQLAERLNMEVKQLDFELAEPCRHCRKTGASGTIEPCKLCEIKLIVKNKNKPTVFYNTRAEGQ